MTTPDKTVLICQPALRQSFPSLRHGLCPHAVAKPTFYTVFDRHAREIGIASYLRINPSLGSIEVDWISMSPLMQRNVMSAEAMYLMMSQVFDDLGYRPL